MSPPLPAPSRHAPALGALALLVLLPLLAPAPVAAGPLSFSEDTGAEAAAATTAWPDRVIVDATTWTLLAVWTTDPPSDQAVPLARIARFERARAWEGRPDELVAVLKDGSRLLVARGAGVVNATTLLGAVTGSKVIEVDPAGPWPAAARDDGRTPDTSLALGSVHTGAQVAATLGSADTSATATASQPRRSQTYDVNEALPANADPEALGAEAIQVAVKQQMSRIRQCYNRELQRDASLTGKVVVWFLIDADGSVSKARLKETTMGNAVVEDCIVGEVGAMTFPKPQAGKVVPVSFPFSFTGG